MKSLLDKIGDARLEEIAGCINIGNVKKFKEIQAQFPEYDPTFLWLLCYTREDIPFQQKYIEENYKIFHQILDSDFSRLLSKKGWFTSRMWEMILCDVLSNSGDLIQKSASGPDFILKVPNGDLIQIEAVAPDEASDKTLRSIRPDYSHNKIFSLTGNIEDLERPILLRVLKGIQDKAKSHSSERPLIIALNSSKTVGLSSRDPYVLGRILFGLGFVTLSMHGEVGFQQNPFLNKPDSPSFPVA
ncbi:MAG: hypothetical protein AAB965_01455, partial [Patescibacteria group bacterium]